MSSSSSGGALVPVASGSRHPSASSLVPATSTRGQTVLSEEAYTTTLSRIIKRDFFPGLARLEAENEYLDALAAVAAADEDDDGGEEDGHGSFGGGGGRYGDGDRRVEDGEMARERLERAVRKLVELEERDGILTPNSAAAAAPNDTPRLGNGRDRQRDRSKTPLWDGETPRARGSGAWQGQTPKRKGEWDPTPVIRRREGDTVRSGTDGGDGAEDEDGEGATDNDLEIKSLSLSAFQSNFTSEDNASFLSIMEAREKRRREQYKWAYEAEKKANERRRLAVKEAGEEAQRGFLASTQTAGADKLIKGTERKLIKSSAEAADESQASDSHQPQQLTKVVGQAEISPATQTSKPLDMWSHQARNSLFYPPDANRTTLYNRSSSLLRPEEKSGQSIFSSAERQRPSVDFSNTRFREDDSNGAGAASTSGQSPRSSRIDAAIEGWGETSSRPALSSSGSAIGGDDDDKERANGGGVSVAGYTFVSPLPSPKPGDLGEARIRQLMTWGAVLGTPRRVDTSSTSEDGSGGGGFKISPTPKRDMLARRLADGKGSLNNSARTPSKGGAAARSSSKRKMSDLSPAARTLFDRTQQQTKRGPSSLGSRLMGTPTREEVNADRLRRQRWTPTPSPRR